MTPEISPFCSVPARLIWIMSPLSATHFICPGSFHQSSLLAVYFPPHADTSLALSNSTMCSAVISTNILTLHVSSRGDFNKVNLRQVMPNFHQHISCPTRGPNTLDHCLHTVKKCLKSPLTAGFWKIGPCRHFPHTPEYKQTDRSGTPYRGRAGPPTLKLCYRRLLMTSTGTCSGRVHLTSASLRM